MRRSVALAAALVALPGLASASADPGVAEPAGGSYAPPFVDHTEWVSWGSGDRRSSLRIYPTPSARAAARHLGTAESFAGQAWTEVLARAPDADTPGMRAQFVCHWQIAEFVQPGKTSWNLEPWRPVVDDAEMIRSGCNPGGRQEPF
ncbi:DUF2599 domain-containing protein [Mycobacterium sp.]|uniref:DUF2599 domain-containing protein n=1 Tax=Mycobacterium sp. TaxID=1785 RepID=UPI00127F1C1F|nr:DUF2599 domain-containing protein [Mycobacterium sp.]KAA8957712.1 MAG: DUF2599 domain-containing protein [Mycobacterium sp.]